MSKITCEAALDTLYLLQCQYGGSGYMRLRLPCHLYPRLKKDNWITHDDEVFLSRKPIQSQWTLLMLLGSKFNVRFDKPECRVHDTIFETYFNFGPHCSNYDPEAIVIAFHERASIPDLLSNLRENKSFMEAPVDESFAKELLMVMIIEGYVKSWEAVQLMVDWFVEMGITSCANFVEGKAYLEYIFDKSTFYPK